MSSKQAQFELFPNTVKLPAKKEDHIRFFLKEMTLSWENLVVLLVFLVVTMVVSFSIGIDQGRRKLLAENVLKARSAATAKGDETPVSSPAFTPAKAPDDKTPPAAEPAEKAGVLQLALADKESVANKEKDVKIYTIQVASFKKEKQAQQEAEQLKKKGFEILVLPKGKYSIVCVGKFEQCDAAKIFLKKLQGRYKDCLVRSL